MMILPIKTLFLHLFFQFSWLLLSYLSYPSSGISISTHYNNNNIRCIDREREALLQFKKGIEIDNCGLLSTWGVQEDCCQWRGIHCCNRTGHVIMLHLRGVPTYHFPDYGCLGGKLDPSLVELKHLIYLDLSWNQFQPGPIPSFIGSFLNLKHLNLSQTAFTGEVPHQLGNLSRLTSLDLSYNDGNNYIKSLGWIFRLSLLRYLDLSSIDLSRATEWYQLVNNLPLLRVLHMHDCSLSPPISSSLSYTNSSTALSVLNLADNNLNDSSIFQWLFNLSVINTRLEHVDLTYNLVPGPIPSSFGKMHSLSYLDLSWNKLEGPIPSALGNLHALSYLDLSHNLLQGPIPSAFGNFHALSYLSLSTNQLEGPIPSEFGNMHPLSYLDLSLNQLQGPIPSAFGNMHSLSYLDLSSNQLDSLIPNEFWNMHALSHLDLSSNKLEGPIPDNISNLKPLAHLDLSRNDFHGSGCIPKTLGNLCSLQFLSFSFNNLTNELSNIIQALAVCANQSLVVLDLSHNQLWGSVPDILGSFSKLEGLDISFNSLNGIGFENHFSNLSSLSDLDLSRNSELILNFSANWVPPFQLDYLHLSYCMLGPRFPQWIGSQMKLVELDISGSGISDTIPRSIWNSSLLSNLLLLNISHNNIYGVLPNLSYFGLGFLEIDLSSNKIEGTIPSFMSFASSLFLNDNMFSDVTPLLCPKTSMYYLQHLDISNNLLSGVLPDCWMNLDQLSILHLENNKFSGTLPSSIGYLKQLETLHLRNNSFFGVLPTSLGNCTSLVILDLGHNSFTGLIPQVIGKTIKNLGVLSLRSNNFSGGLPLSLCQLSHLQILDLSTNHISGTIPDCIFNLTAMTTMKDLLPEVEYYHDPFLRFNQLHNSYNDTAILMWKREEQSFRTSLGQVKYIDLSSNKLDGQIPDGISSLIGLVSLDLSNNNLSGSIIPKVGDLINLEYLDLSCNHLSGEIPASLANLNFLSILDLSYNNLSGKIPVSTQLQGFDISAYMGNPELCGAPLMKCPEDQAPINTPTGDNISQPDENDDDDIFPGLYISIVLGFIIGFWGVCGTLVLKKSWRHSFYSFLDEMRDKIYVMVVLNTARVRRRS